MNRGAWCVERDGTRTTHHEMQQHMKNTDDQLALQFAV
jgi:hypothetical protein